MYYKVGCMVNIVFHSILNNFDNSTNIIKIVFDCQQNQLLPKLSIGEIFYSRQLETEAPRGANEIASCVLHFLNDLEKELLISKNNPEENKLYEIELFADFCANQNKNTISMATVAYFLEKNTIIKSVRHFFPIRGHSYMPPDRVFGRIEKEYRRKENIISPTEYHKILAKTGVVLKIGEDWTLLDLKSQSKTLLKSKMPFSIAAVRKICYNKENGKVKIGIANTYSGALVECEIYKKKVKSASAMGYEKALPIRNMVSTKKSEDIKKLTEFFQVPEEVKAFYEAILHGNKSDEDENDSLRKEYEETETTI